MRLEDFPPSPNVEDRRYQSRPRAEPWRRQVPTSLLDLVYERNLAPMNYPAAQPGLAEQAGYNAIGSNRRQPMMQPYRLPLPAVDDPRPWIQNVR
jgi:hypothetical protein